jgi:hypothetical protein
MKMMAAGHLPWLGLMRNTFLAKIRAMGIVVENVPVATECPN